MGVVSSSATGRRGPATWVVCGMAVVALLAIAAWGYMRYLDRHANADIPLTAEARAYARNLQLSDVEMKASENYFQQAVVEIESDGGTAMLNKVCSSKPRPTANPFTPLSPAR